MLKNDARLLQAISSDMNALSRDEVLAQRSARTQRIQAYVTKFGALEDTWIESLCVALATHTSALMAIAPSLSHEPSELFAIYYCARRALGALVDRTLLLPGAGLLQMTRHVFFELEPDPASYERGHEDIDGSPRFLFDWHADNVNAFVALANALGTNRVLPGWLRTRPPQMTAGSFIDDAIVHLARVVGGRCGHVLLGPSTVGRFIAIKQTLDNMQHDQFMRDAARNAEAVASSDYIYLARTYSISDSSGQQVRPNYRRSDRRHGEPLLQLFI